MVDVRKWGIAIGLALAFGGQALAFGAIAVDDEPQQAASKAAVGVSVGKDSPQHAMMEAMAQCKKQARNCKLVLRFQGCGAYATSPERYGVGTARDKRTAEVFAMRNCGNQQCTIVKSVCE